MNVRVDLASYQWFATTIGWRGDVYADIENFGGSVETVMRVDGHWVGSAHRYETLLDASIRLDGRTYELADGTVYVGDHAVVRRLSEYDGAYRVQTTMDITSDTIVYDVWLTGLDESKNVEVVYGHQGTRANRLTDYWAYDRDGNMVAEGRTDRDDNSFVHLGPTATVVQYDPLAGNGLVQSLVVGGDLEHRQMLWDRPMDNKFYDRIISAEGSPTPDRQYHLTQRITFFEGPPPDLSSWPTPVPAPATLGLLGWALAVGLARRKIR